MRGMLCRLSNMVEPGSEEPLARSIYGAKVWVSGGVSSHSS